MSNFGKYIPSCEWRLCLNDVTAIPSTSCPTARQIQRVLENCQTLCNRDGHTTISSWGVWLDFFSEHWRWGLSSTAALQVLRVLKISAKCANFVSHWKSFCRTVHHCGVGIELLCLAVQIDVRHFPRDNHANFRILCVHFPFTQSFKKTCFNFHLVDYLLDTSSTDCIHCGIFFFHRQFFSVNATVCGCCRGCYCSNTRY